MINVVFGVDGYVSQMAVSMVSLFESNRQNNIQIYIICLNLNVDDRVALDEIAQRYQRSIKYLSFEPGKLKNLKAFFHLSQATFYRLFIDSILTNVSKVIYLDCDIIVEADISEMWNLDITECGNAGVIFNGNDTEKRLGVPGGKDMNAGILLMNLEYWRKNNISEKCVQWLERTESAYMDNDAMNVILNGAQKGIDEKWNLNPIHFIEYSEESKYPSRILHFAGAIKPWHKAYDFSFQKKYEQYLSLTPWIEGYKPKEPWNISQAISVANQHFERGEFLEACGYYNLAIKYRISEKKLESTKIMDDINEGLRIQSSENYSEAAKKFRETILFWAFPISHRCNIYQFPQISCI